MAAHLLRNSSGFLKCRKGALSMVSFTNTWNSSVSENVFALRNNRSFCSFEIPRDKLIKAGLTPGQARAIVGAVRSSEMNMEKRHGLLMASYGEILTARSEIETIKRQNKMLIDQMNEMKMNEAKMKRDQESIRSSIDLLRIELKSEQSSSASRLRVMNPTASKICSAIMVIAVVAFLLQLL